MILNRSDFCEKQNQYFRNKIADIFHIIELLIYEGLNDTAVK